MSPRRSRCQPVLPTALASLCLAAVVTMAMDAAPLVAPATTQLVLVVTPDWDASRGTLAAFDRDATGGWRQHGASHPVMIGRNGCAWGMGGHPPPAGGPRKREGDGRSPAGAFAIGPAFGAEPACDTGLAYRPLTADDWCIDVPDSPFYNRIVNARTVGAAAVAGSTEPMRRDLHRAGDRSYALGFVIGHNAGCERGAGSCIFAHLVGDPPAATAGCTAMTEAQLRTLLGWLRADAQPVFVLLPAQAAGAARGLPPWPRGDTP